MGGPGSGHGWRANAAETTTDFRQLDVRRWQRDGLLLPGKVFSWQWTRDGELKAYIDVRAEFDRVILSYRHRRSGGEWKSEEYPVPLDWTPCTYGGLRAWFRCPAAEWGRRVAILYGGGIFACRRCYRLAYPSQREAAHDRVARRADKIRERLGWKPGILNTSGWKPKGMHWRTFERLSAEHNALVQVALAGIVAKFRLNVPSVKPVDR